MKIRLLVLLLFLFLLHVIPLVQSCRCPEPLVITATVEGVEVYAYAWNYLENAGVVTDPPFDRNNLRLSVKLTVNDSLEWYTSNSPASYIISSAMATGECPGPVLSLNEHIESVSIQQITDTIINLTNNFLVEDQYQDLYEEIESHLAEEERHELRLAYKGSIEGNEVILLVKTGLNDGRIFSDTLKIELK